MAIAYLDVPEGIEIEGKKELVKSIYEAINEAYPFPHDHRIFVHEWPVDSVSQNGQLGSEPPRPVFQIHAPLGLSVEAKRKLTRASTRQSPRRITTFQDSSFFSWSTRRTGWR
jgi:hypothetical protein